MLRDLPVNDAGLDANLRRGFAQDDKHVFLVWRCDCPVGEAVAGEIVALDFDEVHVRREHCAARIGNARSSCRLLSLFSSAFVFALSHCETVCVKAGSRFLSVFRKSPQIMSRFSGPFSRANVRSADLYCRSSLGRYRIEPLCRL